MDEQQALGDIIDMMANVSRASSGQWNDVTDLHTEAEDHYETSKWALMQHQSGLIVKVHVTEWTS